MDSGYPAPLFPDLKHYSVEQLGLKDPPRCDPFWLLKRTVLSGRCSACLYTRESLSMLISQPTNRRSGTQRLECIALLLLVNESTRQRGTSEAAGSERVVVTCNFVTCVCHTGATGGSHQFIDCGVVEREKSSQLILSLH